jgi:plastocyanin
MRRKSKPSRLAMRFLAALLVYPLVTMLALAYLPVGPVRAATTWDVSISGFSFSPDPLVISAGDTVNWTNFDGVSHTSTSDPGQTVSWDSGTLSQGKSFAFTFITPGSYTYHCNVHPTTMKGTIVVQQPIPEFPGFLALATVGLAVALGLAAERRLRG